jgi:hypothetical protein
MNIATPPKTAMIPPIDTLILPAPPDGRTLDTEAGAAETDDLEADADDEVEEAETDLKDVDDADDADIDADADDAAEAREALDEDMTLEAPPEAARRESPTNMLVTVLLPVAAFWYQGFPHASAIFFSCQPPVKAG